MQQSRLSLSVSARIARAFIAGVALLLLNVASNCGDDPPPPPELPALATTAAVGSLPGTTAVTDDGTFTYSAPIPVPPGRAGMEPSLSLTYSSTSAESSLGVGFSISGLSSISRCGQTFAVDGQRRGVELDDEDRLCLDGARLLAVEGEDMQPATVYRTESETWRRIETVESDRVGITGPVMLRVRLPDGRERLYGASNDSRLEITRTDGSRVVTTWHLTQERDPRGNAIRYEYEHLTPEFPTELIPSDGELPPIRDIVRVARIRYTGTASADGGARVDGTRAVEFSYRPTPRTPPVGFTEGLTAPPGPEDGYAFGAYGWTASAFPLESIRTSIAGAPVQELRFEFDESPVFRRPLRLTSVRFCSHAPAAEGTVPEGGVVCLPPTRFQWRNAASTGAEISDERYGAATFESFSRPFDAVENRRDPCGTLPSGEVVFCDRVWPTVVLDANGDGADDLVYLRRTDNPNRPALAVRFGGYVPRETASMDAADVPLGRSGATTIELVPDRPDRDVDALASYTQYASSVDWNLDGRDDLVLLVPAIGENLWEVVVALSSGAASFRIRPTGLFMPRLLTQREFWDGAIRGELDERAVQRTIEVLDLNGDGRSDVLACLTESNARDRFFQGQGSLWAPRGRWWYALRNEDGTLGLPTSGDHRRLIASGVETACVSEYNTLPIAGSDADAHAWESRPVVVDTTGDGLQELLVAPPWFVPLGTVPRTMNMRVLSWRDAMLVERDTEIVAERYRPFDANGDGLHDLITEHVNEPPGDLIHVDPAEASRVLTIAYLSRGNGRFTRVVPDMFIRGAFRAQYNGSGVRHPLGLLGFDMDGDNRGDLLTLAVEPDALRLVEVRLPGVPDWVDTDYYRWPDADVHVTSFLNGSYDVTYSAGITVAGEQYAASNPLDGTYYRAHPLVMDVDGDGALDLVTVARVGAEARRRLPLDLQMHFHHNIRAQPSLVERITDGFGAETVVRYTPLSDSTVYRPSRTCEYPTRCTTDSRYVVQYVWHDDGSDGRAYVEEQHYYSGGRTDLQGRGFLGFQRHAVRNTLTGETIDRRFDNSTYDPDTRSYPGAGVPRAVMHYRIDLEADERGDTQFLGSKVSYERESVTTPEGTHYTIVTSSLSRSFEEDDVPLSVIFGADPFIGLSPLREVQRTMDYDEFGNVSTVLERIRGVSGLSRVDSTFVNDTTQWRIGLPETTVSRTVESGECSLYESATYVVDVARAEVVSVARTGRTPDPTVDRSTTYARDAWGNVTSVSVSSSLVGTPARTAAVVYEPTGYFVNKVINALGHETEIDVEPRFGLIHHVTDPNGVETVRSFDGFGRVREERTSGRGGVEVSYELADDRGRHRVRIDADAGGHEAVAFDRLGRAVESQVQHAFVTSYAARRFDRLGRLALETEPFGDVTLLDDPERAPHTSFAHDDIGRVLTVENAEGVRTRYGYPRNLREVQTAGGGEYVTAFDAAGRVRSVQEPDSTGGAGGRTSYEYCRSGLLRRTFDAMGNTTTVEYDDLGRRTFLDDPAAGLARFAYDAFDELERTEDALGRVSRWERDVLGRVQALHHDAEGITDRFSYDLAPLGVSGRVVVGALASSESGDGVIDTYEYDGLARPVAQSRLVDGRLLRTSSTLDDFGRVTSASYPDALGLGATVLSTAYDPASGEALAVLLDGKALWELRDQDERGAPTAERLGSGSWGVIDRLSERTAAGRLESLTSISGTTVLQDLHYAYSTRGLVEERVDGVGGRTETYEHDALSRLTRVVEGTSTVVQRYASDAIGNLTETHDGMIRYDDPTRPYAATEARGETIEYDAIGNALRVGELSVTYTQRNLPRTVSSSKTGLVQYRYDAGGGRATKRSSGVDITYFGAYQLERRGMLLYERISLDTPVGVVAQLERTSGGPSQNGTSRVRWLLGERQGSVETTWVSGEAPEHHRYDAYGGILNESGRSTGERPSPTVSAGYTGHEHEDDIGLVNMGGRIYSPRLRRFLTADPVVANPFGQGLNAYSYVRGNPLNAVDPFGWTGVEVDLDLAEEATLGGVCTTDGCSEAFEGIMVQVDGPSSDSPSSETTGAGAAGAAVPQAIDSERPGPPRGSLQEAASADLGDLFTLSPQMRDVPRFMESLDERLGGIPSTLHEIGSEFAAAGLTVAVSTIPVVGEVMDGDTMLDDNAPIHHRVMASASLGVSAGTLGLTPNAGALIRAAAHIDDAVRAGRRMFRVGTYRPRSITDPSRLLPERAGPTGHISPSEVAGRTPAQIDVRARELGLTPRGADPAGGRGAYIDPQTGQQRILSHPNASPPHGHVNNPAGQRIDINGNVVPPESPAAHLPLGGG